jgi:hypothetical protein
MTDETCNRCGGAFEPADDGIVPLLRCKDCAREVPTAALAIPQRSVGGGGRSAPVTVRAATGLRAGAEPMTDALRAPLRGSSVQLALRPDGPPRDGGA